jgi:hypothetical protein
MLILIMQYCMTSNEGICQNFTILAGTFIGWANSGKLKEEQDNSLYNCIEVNNILNTLSFKVYYNLLQINLEIYLSTNKLAI